MLAGDLVKCDECGSHHARQRERTLKDLRVSRRLLCARCSDRLGYINPNSGSILRTLEYRKTLR